MSETGRFWSEERLSRLLACDSDQLKELAAAAGFDPVSFFRDVDFSGIDLRNQDLTGIDLSKARFNGAVVDDSTKLDRGKKPLVDPKSLESRLSQLVESAEPYLDISHLMSSLRDVFSKSIPVCVYIESETEILSILDKSILRQEPWSIVDTRRGFINRRNIVIRHDAGHHRYIIDTISDALESAVPDMFKFDQSRLDQLMLPLPNINITRSDRISSSKIGTVQWMRMLRRLSGITNIWYVMPLEPIPGLKDEILRLRKRGLQVQFMFGIYHDDLNETRWIRGLYPQHKVLTVEEAAFKYRGSVGRVLDVQTKSDGAVKFSPAFFRLVKTYDDWRSVRQAVSASIISAVRSANMVPITVGVKHLRAALSVLNR